jgi:hypothetical protein
MSTGNTLLEIKWTPARRSSLTSKHSREDLGIGHDIHYDKWFDDAVLSDRETYVIFCFYLGGMCRSMCDGDYSRDDLVRALTRR